MTRSGFIGKDQEKTKEEHKFRGCAPYAAPISALPMLARNCDLYNKIK